MNHVFSIEINGYTVVLLVSAITGNMFACYYNKDKPCDSGIANYFFSRSCKKAYAAFGYDCITFTNEQIKNNKIMAMGKKWT
jgi:hypothetical protein